MVTFNVFAGADPTATAASGIQNAAVNPINACDLPFRVLIASSSVGSRAAIDGVGVAIGKRPHLMRHLRDGTLVAPFGTDWVAKLGGFYIVVRRDVAARSAVGTFADWLRHEVRLDGDLKAASGPGRRARQQTAGRARSRDAAAR